MFTQDKIDKLSELLEEISDEVDKYVSKYNSIWKSITGEKEDRYFGSFLGVTHDGKDVHIGGDEYWSYGGHERHDEYIPISDMLNPNWETELIAMAEAQVAKKKLREENAKKAKLIEAKKRVEELEKELDESLDK